MDYNYTSDGVRERLIKSGLSELEEHGFSDFSLRRVASLAEVSCAAPYRHFKDKDELILEVIKFVREGWELLCTSISEVYPKDSPELVAELCAAGIRFWLANGSFRSVIFGGMSGTDERRRAELLLFDKPITDALSGLRTNCNPSTVRALFWGTLVLAATSLEPEAVIASMKEKIKEEADK